MPHNDASRSVSHNSIGDNGKFILGDVNVSFHSTRRTLNLDVAHEATFNAANKQHTPTCLENTRAQVLYQIRTWADGDGEKRMYWLRGMAGTGKTTIAMTIAREYYRENRLGASFFFSRGGGDLASARKFVATIANQFAELSPTYREHLSTALETCPSISSRGLYDQWEKLILEPLRLMKVEGILRPRLIIVDALDECDGQLDMGVVIQCLADVTTLENIPFRIFMTSRPERSIQLGFDSILSITRQDFTLHDIEESIVEKDLEIYYEHELISMKMDKTLITEDNIEKLVKKSRGLFIHAATVCRFIRQGNIFAAKRLSSFIASDNVQLESERELDSVYTTVLENAFADFTSLRSDEVKTLRLFFHNIVGSIVMLFDRMSLTDFAIMVGESEGDIIRLLVHLGSVLDVAEKGSRQISVLHPSFRDFLADPKRNSSVYYSISPRKIHGHLLQRCLEIMAKHLRKNMCSIRQPGTRTKDISKLEVDNHISYVLQYACSYWIYHLQQSDIDPREHPGILEFFENRLLFWIEALALIGRLSDGLSMIRILDSLLSRRRTSTSITDVLAKIKPNFGSNGTKITFQSLNAVVHDAFRFLSAHSAVVEDAPLQLYCSALIFSPRTSLIRHIYRHLIPSWILSIPSVFESWDPRLHTIYHSESSETVAFSPDGTLIASGHFGGSVCIWDASTGAQRHNFKEHTEQVVSVEFSPNGKLIASASGKAILVWNAITGVKLRTYQRTHRIRSIRFLPDNKHIIFNTILGFIRSWDFMSNEVLWVSRPPDSQGYDHGFDEITVSADGKLVICGDQANRKKVWFLDTGTGQPLNDAKMFEREIDCIAFSPDNKVLAVSFGKNIELCNISTGATHQIAANNYASEIIFSPDGKFIAIATPSAIEITDVKSKKKSCEIRDPFFRFLRGPKRFAFSPDGAIVASVGELYRIALWDTMLGTEQFVPNFDQHPPSVLAVSLNDNKFASGSYGDALRLWDGQTGTGDELYAHRFRPFIDIVSNTFMLGKLKNRFRGSGFSSPSVYIRGESNIVSITFSPDSNFLACVWKTKTLQVWNTQTKKLLFSRTLTSSTSDDVVFSPNSTLVASLSNKIHFWDTSTGAELYASESPLGQVEAVAFSPDGRFFVSSIPTDHRTIEPSVCDSGDFYGYTHISVYVEYKSHLRFSSDGKLLAYRCGDKVMLLDVETRVFLYAISTYGMFNVSRLAFTRDNKYLAAIYAGSYICIWDVAKGEVIHEVNLTENDQGLCFSLNGRHIASLDKVLGYQSSAMSNCHSPGISLAGGWIKDGGQDIIYFPHDCKRIFDFMVGSSLVFSWPHAGFMREVVQHSGCNVLQLAMGEKVMDERPSGLTSDSVIYSRIEWMLTLWPTCLFVVFVAFLSMYIRSEKQAS